MPITIKDVAKRANVGVGTVSHVINNNPSVSDDPRQRILAAVDDLDYWPNPIAQQLSTGQTLTIGVALPYLTTIYQNQFDSGIEAILL